MNKCFVRGEGHRLKDAEGTEFLDAISGYGAVPFGHNSKWVWQAIREFEQDSEPGIAQPSLLPGAGDLAELLIRHAPPGLRYVTFGNSGTEAVEAAIKACRIATGRLGIVSTENGFHGKTLGALSATGRDFFRAGTGAPAPGFRLIPYGNAVALEQVLQESAKEIAAFIVEPIQGEGGVVEPPPGYLKLVRSLCDRYGVLLIVDEVQTGLGRTGALFACLSEGITPDALTLAKALGGGLLPISACLHSPKAYSKNFALKHSSTFGGNALAMRVGLRVLQHLTSNRERLLEQVVSQGNYLKDGLRDVQREFGSVIGDVRGRGLMLGVELRVDWSNIERGVGSFLPSLGDALGLVAASYLLNVMRVRVAPTMNGANVLRVQPPLTVTREECDWIVRAFWQLASVMASRRSDELVDHLLRTRETSYRASEVSGTTEATPYYAVAEHVASVRPVIDANAAVSDETGRFAFIVHMLDGKSLSDFDRSLESFTPSELEDLAGRLEESAEPSVASTVRIKSLSGHVATGDFIIITKTTQQLLRMSPKDALEDVAAAVRMGKERGAKIVGLGGYTSVVVAQNLRPLLKIGVPLTTGNSYTVVSAIDAAAESARITGRPLEHRRAAIVGGGGSIGSALASLLAERVPSLVLVGRERDPDVMQSRYAVILARMIRHLARRRQVAPLAEGSLGDALSRLPCAEEVLHNHRRLVLTESQEGRILDQVRTLPIRWTTDLADAIAESDLVFLATSSPGELVKSRMVKSGTVICDLSRPGNVSDELFGREDVLVVDGGIVEVPGRPNLGFHFGLPSGLAYACMAETMMLALEHRYEHTSMGRDLQESTLDRFGMLAAKHGFRLAELRARQRPICVSERQRKSLTGHHLPGRQRQ